VASARLPELMIIVVGFLDYEPDIYIERERAKSDVLRHFVGVGNAGRM
jgi:hypothetical protein